MRKLSLPLALASASVGLALSQYGNALSLGMLKVHSYLEQPLDASISYSNSPADGVTLGDGSCLEVDRDKQQSDTGLPVISRIQIQVDGTEQSGVLRIRTLTPIGDPVAVIRLRNQCDRSGHIVREFTFFLDPQPEIRLKGNEEPPKVSTRINLPHATTAPRVKRQIDVPTKEIWTVKRGDTLTGITRHFQPDPDKQKALAKAILASNPAIRNANRINIGQKLTIPELTVLYAANAVSSGGQRGEPEQPAETRPSPKQPQADTPPSQPLRQAGNADASGEVEYKLKLSPTRSAAAATDKPAAGSGGSHGGIDSDDKTAEMLALNEKISNLEQQMYTLRLQLEQAATRPAPAKNVATAKPAAATSPQISSENEGDGALPLPVWLLAGAGGLVLGGAGFLIYRRRRG